MNTVGKPTDMEPQEVEDMVKDMEEALLSGSLTESDRVRVKQTLRTLIIDNYTRGDNGMLRLKTKQPIRTGKKAKEH